MRKKTPILMIRRRCVFLSLLGLVVLVLVANIYFAYVMNVEKPARISEYLHSAKSSARSTYSTSTSSQSRRITLDSPVKQKSISSNEVVNRSASLAAAKRIKDIIPLIEEKYSLRSPLCEEALHKILRDLQPSVEASTLLWPVASKWAGAREVVPARSQLLGSIMKTLETTKFIKAENAPGGTQLKLLLTLEGGQKALFKPQWYERDTQIEGLVYSGKDRHNAEVAAFHLSLLLGLRRVPITVGRRVRLTKEIISVASKSLRDTFYVDEKYNTCFYGKCHYCSQDDPVCGKKDSMEGALIMMLPDKIKLKQHRSPWQRTYKENKSAKWEQNENFCDTIKKTKAYYPMYGPRLFDLIEASIFDFLIGNGDRHHYEVMDEAIGGAVMFIDNGKSFGQSSKDHIDILAPLYQCCLLRHTTWERLKLFSGGSMGTSLSKLLLSSNIAPVLSKEHLLSLDRRLLIVFAAVELCIRTHGRHQVFKDDGYF